MVACHAPPWAVLPDGVSGRSRAPVRLDGGPRGSDVPLREEDRLLEVRESPRGGRGLFATEAIRADVLLMSAPVLLIAPDERGSIEDTIVDHYIYEWDDDGTAALVLGVSSMCNHASDPNAYLWLVPEHRSAELWSTRAIAADEEVTVSYRASGDPDAPLWFDVVEPDVPEGPTGA
jgi:uncharacterized protein